MSDNQQDLRQALGEIAEIARKASQKRGCSCGNDHGPGQRKADSGLNVGCSVRTLPERLQISAARTATRINPVNAPQVRAAAALGLGADIMEPLRIAVLTAKYWGPSPRQLTVSFMESTPSDLRARIVQHLNGWSRTGSISFLETRGVGQVRISRGGGGYWSYLGTDILHIPQNRPTMNLEAFSMSTPDSEYKRVVQHEAGHTLGFPHEHMRRELIARIDRAKAYDYFWRTQRWDRTTVDQQVLTPLDDRSIFATPPDQDSIMCYQLPGSITRDGQPIRGGFSINATDAAFCGRIYPRASRSGSPMDDGEKRDEAHTASAAIAADDWDASEDVEPEEALLQ